MRTSAPLPAIVGAVIAWHREACGFSQGEFAKVVGCSASQWCRVEGGTAPITVETIAVAAAACYLKPGALLARADQVAEWFANVGVIVVPGRFPAKGTLRIGSAELRELTRSAMANHRAI